MKSRLKAALMLAVVAALQSPALATNLYLRMINTTADVSRVQTQVTVRWYAGETIQHNVYLVRGTNNVPVDLAPFGVVPVWYVVQRTNLSNFSVLSTGVVINATGGVLRFSVSSAASNVRTGAYESVVGIVQQTNTTTNIGFSARSGAEVLWSPSTSGINVVDPQHPIQGTSDHAALTNEEYAVSGHIGFSPSSHGHVGSDITNSTITTGKLDAAAHLLYSLDTGGTNITSANLLLFSYDPSTRTFTTTFPITSADTNFWSESSHVATGLYPVVWSHIDDEVSHHIRYSDSEATNAVLTAWPDIDLDSTDDPGTADHSALTNLEYVASGHTGFQAAGDYFRHGATNAGPLLLAGGSDGGVMFDPQSGMRIYYNAGVLYFGNNTADIKILGILLNSDGEVYLHGTYGATSIQRGTQDMYDIPSRTLTYNTNGLGDGTGVVWTEGAYPIFRMAMGGAWTDFELKASTNNFTNVVYFYQSWTPAHAGGNGDTNPLVFYCDDYATDVRAWITVTNNAPILNQLYSTNTEVEYLYVCPSRETGVAADSWMWSTNSKLVWSFVRCDGISLEGNVTGSAQHWNPIRPERWEKTRVVP